MNTLVVGHSQTKYFEKYWTDATAVVLSFSGYRIDHLSPEIADICHQFDVVVVHAGANDIVRSDAATVVGWLQDLCWSLKERNPGYVYICTYCY